jgi:predicted transcriptional regulator
MESFMKNVSVNFDSKQSAFNGSLNLSFSGLKISRSETNELTGKVTKTGSLKADEVSITAAADCGISGAIKAAGAIKEMVKAAKLDADKMQTLDNINVAISGKGFSFFSDGIKREEKEKTEGQQEWKTTICESETEAIEAEEFAISGTANAVFEGLFNMTFSREEN